MVMTLDLTDEETAALTRLLSTTIDADRFPLSPRVQVLRGILAKLRRAAASSEALRAAASKCSEATRTLTSTCDQTNVSASANSPIITQKAHAGGCLVTGRPAVNYRSACLARRS
jgi:hypothetical protein